MFIHFIFEYRTNSRASKSNYVQDINLYVDEKISILHFRTIIQKVGDICAGHAQGSQLKFWDHKVVKDKILVKLRPGQ